MLEFVSESIGSVDRCSSGIVYYLSDNDSKLLSLNNSPNIQVLVDKKVRVLSKKVLSMLITYNGGDEELARRAELIHDCSTYACSCNINDPLTNVKMGPGSIVIPTLCKLVSCYASHLTDPIVDPESIIMTAESENGFKGHHFIVKASIDGGQPLYASKFGPNGRVYLHTFSEILRIYGGRVMYFVPDMKLADKVKR